MRAYRPTTTPQTVPSVLIPTTTTVFRPVPLITNSQRAAWIQESKAWSRTLALTIEQRQRLQVELMRAQQTQANHLLAMRLQREARERRRAAYDTQMDILISSKFLWLISCAGLVCSGFLFLILGSTNVLRERKGSRLGGSTTCDVVPGLTDGSDFSIAYWTVIALYIISKLVARKAVANMVASSEALGHADAAYFRRLSEHFIALRDAGVLMVLIMLGGLFVLMVRGNCDAEICFNVALAMPAVMSWSLPAFIVGAVFLENWYRLIVGLGKSVSSRSSSKKEQREAVGKTGWELLSQDEKDTLEWV